MKTIKLFVLLVAAFGLFFTSCQKDSDIPTSGDSSLGIQLQAINKTFSFVGTKALTAGTLSWDTCRMYVSRIHFEAMQKCGDSITYKFSAEFKIKGPKLVDLFNVDAVLGDLPLQPGNYSKIALQIQSNKRDAGKSPVFYLSGKYTNASGVVSPIAVVINEDIKFNMSAKDLTGNATVESLAALFQLDLSTLISKNITEAELDNAVKDGKIVISKESNIELYKKILKRVDQFKYIRYKRGNDKH
ncbi:hypothetical protein [Bacteroides sedimenti]|uniref:Uncharacterized protein n=1 Tax=Bacteroides sedimenti TaxID=2136147 RepID=A0ABM8I8Q2_9BACE